MAGNPVQTISVQATDSPALPVWRRAAPVGEALDLKKHHSDAKSSSASETGTGAASETEDTSSVHGSELPSDVCETFTSRASELSETGGESMSEVETSEMDSEAGDVVEGNILPEHLPLLKGLKGRLCKRKRLQAKEAAKKAAEADTSKKPVAKEAESAAMPPPKKLKKSKA